MMKINCSLLFISGLMLSLCACKKDGSNAPSIIGKWSIVKTRYYNAQNTTVAGAAGDYYNFSADGKLFIQSHPDSYTGVYSLNGTKSVNITTYTVDGHGLGVITAPAVFTISDLTDHSVTLTSPPYPSGQEIVFLEK